MISARIWVACAASVFAVAGCAQTNPPLGSPPTTTTVTPIQQDLQRLPPAERKVVAAVYRYTDQTGQFKPSDTVQTLSRAVSQGALSVLVKALQDAGQGTWFTVVEREGLDNLLKERAIIREQRERFLAPSGAQLPPPPPLLYAGIVLDGGIIGYDTNTLTGGAGAQFLGIGASTEYREDTVTVYLRAVSTQSGEVLKTVTSKKTIFSHRLNASIFKFIAFKELLEVEAGFSNNEPGLLALRQAIEKAVYDLIVEGAAANLWQFQNVAEGERIIQRHYAMATPGNSEMYQKAAALPYDPPTVVHRQDADTDEKGKKKPKRSEPDSTVAERKVQYATARSERSPASPYAESSSPSFFSDPDRRGKSYEAPPSGISDPYAAPAARVVANNPYAANNPYVENNPYGVTDPYGSRNQDPANEPVNSSFRARIMSSGGQ